MKDTTELECMYCNRTFLVYSDEWRSGKEFNCCCEISNGGVKIGRFRVIKEIMEGELNGSYK